jgi:phage terminase small subunit
MDIPPQSETIEGVVISRDHIPAQSPVSLVSGEQAGSGKAARDGLTQMARLFCRYYVINGGNGTQAAIEAGYGGGASNMAARNLCKPAVQAEIARLSKVTVGAALPIAIARLVAILEKEGKEADPRAQVQAAVAIMDRSGLHIPRGPSVALQINQITGPQAQEIIAEVHKTRLARLNQSGDGS